MTMWSQVTQWFGYVGYCASASDPACRPFVGFLALAGASAGALTLLALALLRMLRAVLLQPAAASAAQCTPEREARKEVPMAEPVLGLGVAAAVRAMHVEPALSGVALAMAAEPAHGPAPMAATIPPGGSG